MYNSHDAAGDNLSYALAPIQELLDNPKMTNCFINGVGPGMAFVERGNGVEQISMPFTFKELDQIAKNAAARAGQFTGEDAPIVEAQFPPNLRVHIIRPPAVPSGTMSFSIRRPSQQTVHPDRLQELGVFDGTVDKLLEEPSYLSLMRVLYGEKRWREFLWAAVANQVNIVFSGRPDTGKTFNMRSFTYAIPKMMRIITIEDTRELLDLPCSNVVHMLYSNRGQSISKVTATELVEAAMRMGVEGLLVQELRDGAGAFSFLSMLQSGSWGMSTTHAESAEDALPRISGLIRQHEIGRLWEEESVLATLRKSIPIVVHCVRRKDGRRQIEQVLWRHAQGT